MLQRISFRVVLAVTLTALTTSCSSLDSLLGKDRPSASIESVNLAGITLDSARLAIEVRVDNPYSVALPIAALEASLSSTEQRIVETRHDGQLSVPPHGYSVVPLDVDLSFPKLLRLLTAVRPGMAVPYRADLTISVDAPVLGRVALPLSHDGEFPIPSAPQIKIHDMVLDQAGLGGISGRVALDVTNGNDFAMDDTALDLELKLGDRSLSRLRRVDGVGNLEPGATQTVDLGFSLSATEVGLGLLDLITGRSAQVRAQGKLGFDSRFGLIGTTFDSANEVGIRKR